jgi:hypothetical protein
MDKFISIEHLQMSGLLKVAGYILIAQVKAMERGIFASASLVSQQLPPAASNLRREEK